MQRKRIYRRALEIRIGKKMLCSYLLGLLKSWEVKSIMEYLNRKIKIKQKDSVPNVLRVDIIDGMRLSLRFLNDEDPDDDIVINFTKEETDKIKRVLNPVHIQVPK
jgi:hypothetical protein